MPAVKTGIRLDSLTSRSDPHAEAYLARYDSTETPASMAVVAIVSEALGRGPAEMEPLYYAVDAEALNELLAGEGVGDAVSVTFDYEGCEVTVTADEVTAVRATADDGTDARSDDSISA